MSAKKATTSTPQRARASSVEVVSMGSDSTSGNALPQGWALAKIDEVLATLDDGRTLHQGWSPRCEKELSLIHI